MPRFTPSAASLIAAGIAALGLSVWANADRSGAAAGIEARYDRTSGKLTELAYDADHDGRADTWTEMDGTRALRSRIDRNGDGTIDRWEEYDASGALAKVGFSRKDDGRADAWMTAASDTGLQRIEISSTGDERRIDRWEYYDVAAAGGDGRGALVRVEEDTIGDGRPHKWEIYSNGALQTAAFDEDGDGSADRRLTYRNSALVAIESNPDSAGRFRTRREINR